MENEEEKENIRNLFDSRDETNIDFDNRKRYNIQDTFTDRIERSKDFALVEIRKDIEIVLEKLKELERM